MLSETEFLELSRQLIEEGRYPFQNPPEAMKQWLQLRKRAVACQQTVVECESLNKAIAKRGPLPPKKLEKVEVIDSGVCENEPDTDAHTVMLTDSSVENQESSEALYRPERETAGIVTLDCKDSLPDSQAT